MTVTLEVIDGDAELDQTSFTVTILDPPEFISDADKNAQDNKVVNDDYFELFFDSDKSNTGEVVYAPQLHKARPVEFSSDITSSGGGDIQVNMTSGEIIYAVPTQYGSASLLLNAFYASNSNLSDRMSGVVEWASITTAKNDIDVVYQSSYTTGYWWIGTNTCQRFAFQLDNDLRNLKSVNPNVSHAVKSINVVTFTTSGIISLTSPKHAAVQIILNDGTEFYYDNGAIKEGSFIRGDFPSWMTPDF